MGGVGGGMAFEELFLADMRGRGGLLKPRWRGQAGPAGVRYPTARGCERPDIPAPFFGE